MTKSSIYEIVETGDTLPFDVSLHSVNYVPSHWHNSMEMIFVLSGTLEVTVHTERHTLTEGDILLINQGHVHEVIGLDVNIIATFLIPFAYMKTLMSGLEGIHFECDSASAGKERKPALERIRGLLAEMVQLKYKQGEVYELDMQSRMLAVFSILIKQFKVPGGSGAMNEKYMERMLRIITYIDEHYQEPITLQAIAEREYLSVPYLSKFFSENIGLNFGSYLTSIRLKHTVEALLRHSDAPIADLAHHHGFPNAKSFYTAFKNRYRMTPKEYRERYRPEAGAPSPPIRPTIWPLTNPARSVW
ncbi:AraC family transcriptional regulator [Paenibacillus sp. P26]|nr:AraC family transcriptional regulator [Paenibacillus sp. P26]